MLERFLRRFGYVQRLEQELVRTVTASTMERLELITEIEDLKERLRTCKNDSAALTKCEEYIAVLQETNCTIKQEAHAREIELLEQNKKIQNELTTSNMVIGFMLNRVAPIFKSGNDKYIWLSFKEQEIFRDSDVKFCVTGPELGLRVKVKEKL